MNINKNKKKKIEKGCSGVQHKASPCTSNIVLKEQYIRTSTITLIALGEGKELYILSNNC